MTFWVSMELYAKFANAAKAKGLPMSALLTALMQAETQGMGVTEEQLRDMARRVRMKEVTPADVAAEIADRAAIMAADTALFMVRPSQRNASQLAATSMLPLQQRGKRKR